MQARQPAAESRAAWRTHDAVSKRHLHHPLRRILHRVPVPEQHREVLRARALWAVGGVIALPPCRAAQQLVAVWRHLLHTAGTDGQSLVTAGAHSRAPEGRIAKPLRGALRQPAAASPPTCRHTKPASCWLMMSLMAAIRCSVYTSFFQTFQVSTESVPGPCGSCCRGGADTGWLLGWLLVASLSGGSCRCAGGGSSACCSCCSCCAGNAAASGRGSHATSCGCLTRLRASSPCSCCTSKGWLHCRLAPAGSCSSPAANRGGSNARLLAGGQQQALRSPPLRRRCSAGRAPRDCQPSPGLLSTHMGSSRRGWELSRAGCGHPSAAGGCSGLRACAAMLPGAHGWVCEGWQAPGALHKRRC